jgi:hypothetical protein
VAAGTGSNVNAALAPTTTGVLVANWTAPWSFEHENDTSEVVRTRQLNPMRIAPSSFEDAIR